MKTYWHTSAYLVRNTLNIYMNQKCLENIKKKTHVYVTLGFKP